MRIVIIGEFSSFSKNLSEGFRALGHECFVFSWGDGFKKIDQDARYSYSVNKARYNGDNIITHIYFIIHSLKEQQKLKRVVNEMKTKRKWDVVLIVSEGFIREENKFWSTYFSKEMVCSLINDSQNIFLSACGSDVPFYNYWKDKNWKNKTMVSCFSQYGKRKMINHHYYVTSFANKIIPVMYGYAEAWRNSKYAQHCMIMDTIPLPVNSSMFESNNNFDDKLVIFHGITRPSVKGTEFIKQAMERLQKDFPDLVECRAEGGMPLKDYLLLMNRTNIQIDQACCEYVGMNGLYALAMGKVVLGGNEKENQIELKENDCPIINIQPDSEQIYETLKRIIMDRDYLKELSKQSRVYVERVHDAKKVAQKYIDIFSKFLNS